MEGDSEGCNDPFNWSVDQVVKYLCHGSFDSWARSKTPLPRPDPSILEAVLRENDVTGEILLAEVDRDILLHDFALRSLGQRATIFKAIQHLRSSSSRYQSYTNQLDVESTVPSPQAYLPSPNNYRTPQARIKQPRPSFEIPQLSLPEIPSKNSPDQSLPLNPEPKTNSPTATATPPALPQPVQNKQSPPATKPLRLNERYVTASDGKKRRKVILGPPVSEHRPRRNGYLGFRKFPVADVFYKEDESGDDDSFCFVRSSELPHGQARFTHRCMQHYLQQPPQPLKTEDGESAVAILPYTKAMAQDSTRYITTFVQNGKKVVVSKEDVSRFPQLNEGDSKLDYLLVKYPTDDHDTGGLPLYGDSGSEGGYDSETWKEIDNERENATNRDAMPNDLSPAEIDTIINESVDSFIEDWKVQRLPIETRKSWKIWSRSRAMKTRHTNVKMATNTISLLEERLKALRKAVKASQYQKKNDVRQQCLSMENTVFERELQRWKVSVLELDTCPPKPPKAVRVKPPRPTQRNQLPDGEESLGSDSNDSSDGLSDFVSPDEVSPSVDIRKSHHVVAPSETLTADPDTEDEIVTPRQKQIALRKSHSHVVQETSDVAVLPHLTPTQSVTSTPFFQTQSTPLQVSTQNIEVVDLTKSDDELQPTAANDGTPSDFEIRTPPLNPVKLDHQNIHSSIILDDDVSLADEATQKSDISLTQPLPHFSNMEAILKLPWTFIEERRDRKRFLAKLIYSIADKERNALCKLVAAVKKKNWGKRINMALQVLLKKKKPSHIKQKEIPLYMRMATLYVSWEQCMKITERNIHKDIINSAIIKNNLWRYYKDLTAVLRSCAPKHDKRDTSTKQELSCKALPQTPKKPKQEPPSASKAVAKEIDNVTSEENEEYDEDDEDESQGDDRPTPHKKRKRAVKESQEAMDTQKRAQRRVEAQETLRRNLFRKQEESGMENYDPEKKIVSFKEPIICLEPHIGRRVKPHQLSGIQFMWRELITDEKRQGCLLAHTMGLGKTMQVISLLITIANASNSPNPRIRSQIPEALRRSRTLVLCPSSLIENWWEEFLIWTPHDEETSQNLGSIRKVLSNASRDIRINEISCWHSEGGVLLIGYDIFRTMVLNRETKSRPAPYGLDVHDRLKEQLLSGPNIVIADEAHKMKNRYAGIAAATSAFSTKSRIALTGSPLANNLDEYYSMINWISPGYLGDPVQFKAKYVEPIVNGLYIESTRAERRESLKKLQVLKVDLEPKINRADISVLEDSLPQKVEFMITVPLTPLQEQAYKIYVEGILSPENGDIKLGTRLWDWLGVLTLLCNHPSCFLNKLIQRNDEKKAQKRILSDSDPDCTSDEMPISQALPIANLQKVFEAVDDIKSILLSHRAQIVDEIVEESIRVGDKVLVFSQSIPTLDYLEHIFRARDWKVNRLDGKTPIASRQSATKSFNRSDSGIYLISTKAGGLGLNIPGANRVIIFDFDFNPTWEEQAVGRVYRLGQQKDVFVYRFICGGTFEDAVYNKTVFKKQLSFRVVDKKSPLSMAERSVKTFLFPPTEVKQEDLSEFKGKDPHVLDKILSKTNAIRKISLTETFQREDNEKLTPEEEHAVQEELDDERLKRNNPDAWRKKAAERARKEEATLSLYRRPSPVPNYQHPSAPALIPTGSVSGGNGGPPPLPPDMSMFKNTFPSQPVTNGSFRPPMGPIMGPIQNPNAGISEVKEKMDVDQGNKEH